MSKHELGDGPIEAQWREMMNESMKAVDTYFNGINNGSKQVGVVMLVFPFGSTDGRCNFISNGADRKDLIVLFREMIARFEGQPEMKGKA